MRRTKEDGRIDERREREGAVREGSPCVLAGQAKAGSKDGRRTRWKK